MNRTFSIIGLIFILIYLSIVTSVVVGFHWVESFDLSIISAVQSQVTDTGASIVSTVTDIGGTEGITILTITAVVILFIKKMYFAGLWFGMTVLISPGFMVSIMKRIIGRDRPDFLVLSQETSLSFPSGHSTASTVFFGTLGLALILSFQTIWKKYVTGLITCLVILFVMTSRIYLGVHFPTDVLAGFSFGTATILLSIWLYHLVRPSFLQWLSNKNITDKSPAFYS